MSKGDWTVFQVSHNGTEISRFQFADDTLFFVGCEKEQIQTLNDIVAMFKPTSGLRIDFSKRALFQLRGQEDRVAESLECVVDMFPTTYPDLPLGTRSGRKELWETNIQWIQNRVVGWKHKLLPKAGRLTLLIVC